MERRDHIKSGCYIMEIQILHWFETLHNPITNPIFYVITTLGNAGWFWIVLAVLMLTVLPKKYKKAGLTMAIALILSLIFCNGIMKHLWARPRAFWVVGQNFVVGNEFENLYGIFNSIHDYSFPSGHSSASFAAAVSIFMWRKEGRKCGTGTCGTYSIFKTVLYSTLSNRCACRYNHRCIIWCSGLFYC